MKNGDTYQQVLNTSETREPSKENPLNKKLYYTTTTDNLLNFDVGKVFQNATNIIQKESNDGFEFFMISNITLIPLINWKGAKSIDRQITIQATKKGEESEYKLNHKKISSSKNFYEFKFEILENSEVKFDK